jgi:hypothetical protein
MASTPPARNGRKPAWRKATKECGGVASAGGGIILTSLGRKNFNTCDSAITASSGDTVLRSTGCLLRCCLPRRMDPRRSRTGVHSRSKPEIGARERRVSRSIRQSTPRVVCSSCVRCGRHDRSDARRSSQQTEHGRSRRDASSCGLCCPALRLPGARRESGPSHHWRSAWACWLCHGCDCCVDRLDGSDQGSMNSPCLNLCWMARTALKSASGLPVSTRKLAS